MTLEELATWLTNHGAELKVQCSDDDFIVNIRWKHVTLTKLGPNLTATIEEAIKDTNDWIHR